MMRALIVDDEAASRNSLKNLITEHCPQVSVAAMATNISSAVEAIKDYQPHIVFLDVEMPGENGFQLFNYFDDPNFEVIFTTAYSEYALKAFEVSAIDYLLKPLDIKKLTTAVGRVVKYGRTEAMGKRLTVLKETLEVGQIRKIAVPVLGGLYFGNVDDIIYLQAEGSYTYIFTQDRKELISKKIKDFGEMLQENLCFFRIHRSYIVNVRYVKEYIKSQSAYLVLENGDTIPVARERRQAFEALIRRIRIGAS